MTTVDWLIVAFTVLLAFYGYLQGFIVGLLSLVGFALGAFLGTRLAPLLLPSGSHSQYAPLFGLVGALLAGGVLASGFEGLGVRARSRLRVPGLRALDGLLGAAFTACVGLGIAWIVGAVALQSAGSQPLRRDIQRSEILRDARRAATAVGADPSRARAVRPAAISPRAASGRGAADGQGPRGARRPRGAGERGARRRVRVRPRDRGKRVGRVGGARS